MREISVCCERHAHTSDFGRQPSTVPTDARRFVGVGRPDKVLFGNGSLTVLKWQVTVGGAV